jgi:hypothetical protein
MRLIDPKHPFFARTWVRWATVLVPAAVGLGDLAAGNWLWAAVFCAAAGYAAWELLIRR